MAETSILDIPPSQLTPGMMQYKEAKQENPDCLIMLRMGDFYEMFYEDAVTASRELEITLTARGQGEKRAPLAGIPYHALETYLGKLVRKGYKVAIIEQLEDPKQAKGLVKRGLVRIVTPGTVLESSLLAEKENNYILALTAEKESFSLACCDISTGEFFVTCMDSRGKLWGEVSRLAPRECLVPQSLCVNRELLEPLENAGCFLTVKDDAHFRLEKASRVLAEKFPSLALERRETIVAGALLGYLQETQKGSLGQIQRIKPRPPHIMFLDGSTLRNLEILRNIKDGTARGTLMSVLDKTVTPAGSRLLRKWVTGPLLDISSISARLDAVEELRPVIFREEIREMLKKTYDIERLVSRINYGSATPRDILALRQSLQQVPLLQAKIQRCRSSLLGSLPFHPLPELSSLLEKSVRDDAPLTVREGGIIKQGYHQELDELHRIKRNSKQFLQALEQKERERTGISTLKIGFTRVFGYFIEVSRRNSSLVPTTYIRKQTTVNSERYITEELKQEEEKILNAQERIEQLEYELFQDVLQRTARETARLQETASALALLDVLCSLGKIAVEQSYVRPVLTERNVLSITKGRHPVVEQSVSPYVPNDVRLEDGEMMIITGANMVGKSTVLRQTALIVLLAQMGSFVPAGECVMGIADRIFSRVGAYDDVSSGQSTFMVEMTETASIVENATARSLIILDEIGRGTSTFDGISLAWSVAEYIHTSIKAKTLFATHYHVLNKLADHFLGIKNYNVAVDEKDGEVIFLHRLVPGGTDQSYGLHVAKLAGLPPAVITRAREIQATLERDDQMVRKMNVKKVVEQKGLGDF